MRAKQGGEEVLKWQKKVDEGKKRFFYGINSEQF